MALYVRELEDEEWEELELLIQEPEPDLPLQRLQIVLLSAQEQRVQEISTEVDLHPINVRKWIHRFNDQGLEGLRSGKSPGRPPVFTEEQRQQIVDIANAEPRDLNLNFSRWSLQRLRKYLLKQNVVDQISVETIRQVLRANGLKHRTNRGWCPEKKKAGSGYRATRRAGRFSARRPRGTSEPAVVFS